MIRRAVTAWLAGTIGLLAAVIPVAADEWPEHGFFAVRSTVIHGGLKACEIQLSPQTDKLFSLLWLDVVGPVPLIVAFLSADVRIAQAQQVGVSIDGAELFSFAPTSQSINEDRANVMGPVRDASAAWDAMQQAAASATWLTVTAGDTSARVPANGLREALADFAECRQRRSL